MSRTGSQGSVSAVLIVDDDVDFCLDLATVLSQRFQVEVAYSGEAGLERWEQTRSPVVLLDIDLGEGPDGFALLTQLRRQEDPPGVIMLTGDRDVSTVVRAIKGGAFHYVCKPPDVEELANLVNLCSAEARYCRRIKALQEDVERLCGEFVAVDQRTRQLLSEIERVAPTDATVLITGDCGTGKEMVARRVHDLSGRREGPFVGISCAAIPPELIEAEMFGHEKGAFTGADRLRAGKFELACGGTLFLDEVGEGPEALQVKLLRALEERSFYRVGGQSPVLADVRVVAATSRDLEGAVAAGEFRQELYYRLNVFRVHLPPLRERPDDILPLARHFLVQASLQFRRQVDGFAEAAEAALLEHPWPGNVRELRNTVERAVLQGRTERIGVAELFAGGAAAPEVQLPYHEAKRRNELQLKRRYLVTQLRGASGNITLAAERSGLLRQAFSRMLKESRIDPREFLDRD